MAVEHDVVDEEIELAVPAERRLTLRDAGQIGVVRLAVVDLLPEPLRSVAARNGVAIRMIVVCVRSL